VFKAYISVRNCFTEGILQTEYRKLVPNFCNTHCILKLHPYFWVTILKFVCVCVCVCVCMCLYVCVEGVQSHQSH